KRAAIETKIKALDEPPLYRGTYFDADAWGDLYFLWSVERVAVLFDLKDIGGKGWCEGGVKGVLADQKGERRSRERFPGVPDTCFALLFLRRANVAKDLTDKLRLLGAVAALTAPPRRAPFPAPPARKDA